MLFRTVYKNMPSAEFLSLDALGALGGVPAETLKPQRLSWTERIAPFFLVVADIAALGIATAFELVLVAHNSPDITYLGVGPISAMIALYLVHGYSRKTDFISLEYFSEHLIAIVLSAACALLVTYVYSTFELSVKPSRAAIPLQVAVFAFLSLAARRFIGVQIEAKHALGSLLVLGEGKKAESFCRNCVEFGIKRNIELISPTGEAARLKSFGRPSEGKGKPPVQPVSPQASGFVEVVLACDVLKLQPTVLRQLIRLHCSGVRVQTVEAFQEQHWHRVNAQAVGPDWLFDSEFRLAHGSIFSQLKRLMDLVVSFCSLVILSPVLLLIACMVGFDSRGPVLFRQERVGREGRLFTMCKFRTMYENTGDIYTQKGDNRITRTGRWLRLFRLDELPQLWNVLIGDMSLIGPRAEWVKCAEIYEQEIPHYHIRHLVHPGITGWAQVKYRYGENTDDALKKFEYDLYYIRNFSFEMDIRIAIKTIHTMLCGKGR